MFLPLWVIGLAIGLAFFASVVGLRTLFRVRRGAATFRAVAEGSSDGLVLMERDSRILWANEAYCRIMGYPLDKILGRYPLEFALPPHMAVSKEEARAFRFDPAEERFGKLTQVENIRGNGELFIHEFSHAVIRTEKQTRFLLASRDVTERMERERALIAAQDKLSLLSRQDSLTGLSNRHCHAQTLAELVGTGVPFAVLQIDMNDFKSVNDTYGHTAGDALLAHFAKTLTSMAEADWKCARVGGDEFTVLIPEVWALGMALEHASRIFRDTQVPMKWQTVELCPSVSVGAAIFNGQGQSVEDILSCADLALYTAKAKTGERVAGYDDDMHRANQAQLALEQDLAKALSSGAIGFELSPVVDVYQHKLLRFDLHPVWRHPTHGHLSHGELWHAARKLCQTEALERRMLQCARDCLAQLAAHDLGDIGIGLALSGAGLILANPDDLAWLSDGEDPAAKRVSLTLPGDCLADANASTEIKTQLARLSAAGLRILLDNPGLNVTWVQSFAGVDVDGICLDPDLVRGLSTDKTAEALVTATAGLAAALDIALISANVSRLSQISTLQLMGCVELAGPAIAAPMALDQALTWAKTDWPSWAMPDAAIRTEASI